MNDAQNSILKQSRVSIVQLPTIETNDPLHLPLDQFRVNQQTLLPASIKTRLLGDILSSTTPTPGVQPTASEILTLADGSSTSFLFSIADTQGRAIIAIPAVSIYTGPANSQELYPNNTFNMATFPVTVYNDYILSVNNTVVTHVLVGNISGVSVPCKVVCSWKVVTQPNTTLSSALVNTSLTVETD